MQAAAFPLTAPVYTIFSRSLESGLFPDLWKTAAVIPMYKGKGSKREASNSRPISCTPLLGKILESIVKNSLLKYTAHKLLNNAQHGFRPLRSVVSNLLVSDALISKNVDLGHSVDIILFDMSKAFDVVSHKLLLHKLEKLGLGGILLSWIKSFLENRFQRVRIGIDLGSLLAVLSGVIQGSVLGPMLFVMFINDLVDVVVFAKPLFYADDLKLIMPLISDTSFTDLQYDINRTILWMKTWGMTFNTNKCCVLHVGPRNPRHVYLLNGVEIPVRTECPDLGVLRDENFTYSKHADATIAKCHRLCGCLLRAFSTRNPHVLTTAFVSYIRPVLEFASPIWSPRTLYLARRLERVQKLFTRRLHGLNNASYANRVAYLNIDKLCDRSTRTDLILLYKIIHGLVDIDLGELYLSINTNNTRANGLKLVLPRPHKNVLKFSFAYRSGVIWNKLPLNVVTSPSLTIFVSRLRKLNLDVLRGQLV